MDRWESCSIMVAMLSILLYVRFLPVDDGTDSGRQLEVILSASALNLGLSWWTGQLSLSLRYRRIGLILWDSGCVGRDERQLLFDDVGRISHGKSLPLCFLWSGRRHSPHRWSIHRHWILRYVSTITKRARIDENSQVHHSGIKESLRSPDSIRSLSSPRSRSRISR